MQMKNRITTFCFLSLFIATGCSASEPVHVASNQPQQMKAIPEITEGTELNNSKEDAQDKEKSVAEQLARIKSEVVLLKAETARAEARKQLEQMTGVKKDSEDGGEGIPLLKSIYGNSENQLSAEFKFDSGDVVDARVGTMLPGNFKVMAITSSSAQLLDKNGNSHIINVQHSQERERDNHVTGMGFSSNIPAPRLR